MKTPLPTLLTKAGLDSSQIAASFGVKEVTIVNKLAGRRNWSLAEGIRLAALISKKTRRRVVVEEIDFSTPAEVAAAATGGK